LAKARKGLSTSTGGSFTGYHKGKAKLNELIAEAAGEQYSLGDCTISAEHLQQAFSGSVFVSN
jgi:hypothetical protein